MSYSVWIFFIRCSEKTLNCHGFVCNIPSWTSCAYDVSHLRIGSDTLVHSYNGVISHLLGLVEVIKAAGLSAIGGESGMGQLELDLSRFYIFV